MRSLLCYHEYYGLDGELMVVDKSTGAPLGFSAISSAVMSYNGQPEFQFWVFDSFGLVVDLNFRVRSEYVRRLFETHPIIKPLRQSEVRSPDETREFAAEQIKAGFEGVVLRDPQGPYKSGRSTLKQQWMIKYKEFSDTEGTVVGFEELFHNQNAQERDAFGLAERSDRKEGMVAAGTLGALVLNTSWGLLRVGTGFDSGVRQDIWNRRGELLGRAVTFKYQVHGMQDLPRFPVFLRFRED
jgi:DNA ligase-1